MGNAYFSTASAADDDSDAPDCVVSDDWNPTPAATG